MSITSDHVPPRRNEDGTLSIINNINIIARCW
jgi:hypothetical protein